MKCRVLAMWLCLVIILPAFGQEKQQLSYFWLSAGTGSTSVQDARWEMSVGFSADVVFGKHLIGARHLRNKEFIIFSTPHQVNEIAFYWGRYYLGLEDDVYASLAVGPALETYFTYGDVKPNPSSGGFGTYHYLEPNYTLGLALDARAGVNFGRFFSLGLHGFADVNFKKTIAGALFELRVGYVRRKND
jgi:hypothetical protein